MTLLLPAVASGIDIIHHCRAEELLAALPDACVDLIATDPPYYKVKMDQAWDRQWDTAADFLAWMGGLLDQMRRVLKPNGSLYVFASPEMAWGVEGEVRRRFSVLNSITWFKPVQSHAEQYGPENFRQFVEMSERIMFAEHLGSDNMAKGESTYGAACDELHGFVFEPLRAYLAGERDRAGIDNAVINEAWCEWKGVNSTSQTQKWFSSSCFNPPTREAYDWLRSLFVRLVGSDGWFRREYEDLRREYEDLRREYEDLRRPFNVSADVPYTDVWTFPTVGYYDGKHPAEKPLAMMEHIVRASSRPGAVVLDPFCGSGTTLRAAKNLGRHYIGGDFDAHWVAEARQRCDPRFGGYPKPQPASVDYGPLFAAVAR